ncbi:SsgA family sporulation/cell division regulator [Streptomyces sp. NBC_01669]|uniref:SsgA family sporulation/cell division regulator n=1 Tax=Streptomyces sp. NBC_01669 TaxID=2975909 RepID=UPI002250E5D9|nr:SsgA family sporulation/cell division regulator [Streptomyces sp. NBC_01669]MCX4539014.1 SsgA family sporulation/cell division regulator [Streptomyces sp. NBC_01669]
MDHLAAMDDEFDALLDASSLGAPHVVAETGAIPATARRRMAQAARRRHSSREDAALPDDTSCPRQFGELRPGTCPEARAHSAQTPQDEPPAPGLPPHPERQNVISMTTGAGKSVIFAALWVWHHSEGFGIGRDNRRELHAQRSWSEPPTGSMTRAAVWLLPRPPRERTARVCPPRVYAPGSGLLAMPGRWQTPRLPQWLTPTCHLIIDELRLAAFARAGYEQGPHLLSPYTGTHTAPKLHASGWAGPGQHRQRPQDLRQLIQPSVQPAETVFRAVPTGLLISTTQHSSLHIARFADFAYTAVNSGLLLPNAASAPRLCHPFEENGRTRRDLRRRAQAGRARLWETTVHGVRVLHAELPMSFHSDEHESLALTSSLHTRLTYRVSDPYAVEVRFRADTRDETVWTFARDLLRNGLERSSGLGDVIVWPGTGAGSEGHVYIRLTSPEGTALLSAADTDLRAFTEAADSLVAYGTEYSYLAPALDALETTIGELARPGGRE